MNLSIFEVLGPVMVGPSSSHTAGAAKLARTAAQLAPRGFCGVRFALAGSFAKTGRGHGTHRALLAGALGLAPDDERLRDAYALARTAHVDYAFTQIELPDEHENTVRITFLYPDGAEFCVQGSSIGGGRIVVTQLEGMPVEVRAEAPTLVLTQRDVRGVVSSVSGILAQAGLNIGVMRVSRAQKGTVASCVIETDAPIPAAVTQALKQDANILSVHAIAPLDTPAAQTEENGGEAHV